MPDDRVAKTISREDLEREGNMKTPRRPQSRIRPELVTLNPAFRHVVRGRAPGRKSQREGVVPLHAAQPTPALAPFDIKNPPDGGDTFHASFGGGALMPHVSLVLIFWGNAWTRAATSPAATQVRDAVQTMLDGPYLSGLDQYGIGRGTLKRAIIVLSDPPETFNRSNWHDLIWNLIDQDTFPEPDDDGGRNFYMIVLPPGIAYSDPNVTGIHGYPGDYDFPFDYDVAWGGFVLNDGTLDTITTRLSHELVEACTDTEDDGWTVDGRSHPDNEIGDICQDTVGQVDGVMVQGYWSNRDQACIIPQRSPPRFAAGRGLAVARQPPNDQLTALCVDADGVLTLTWEVDNGPWNFPVGISAPGFAPPGASVVAIRQPPNAQLDAFVIDSGGALQVLFEVNNGKWSAPIALTPSGFAPAGCHLAVARQPPNDQLTAFIVDVNGVLNVLWEVDNGPWHAPVPITGPTFAPPGAPIVALQQMPNQQLDALLVGSDGALHVLFEVNNGPWSAPIRITPPNFVPPGARLAAARQPPYDQLTAFIVDVNGALNVLWEVNNGAWHAPVPITGAGFAPPGAGVAVARQPPNDQLTAFIVDVNGALNVLWEVDNGAWHAPVPITGAGFAPAGAELVSVQQPPNAQLDVFVVTNDARVTVLFEVDNSAWSAPIPIT
jgi:hypothetical protein